MTAAPITSAGRFSPRGPRGISFSFLCCICEPLIIRRDVQQLLPSLVQTHFDGQISELLRAFAPVLGIVKGRWKHRRQTFPRPLSVTQFGLFDYARQIRTEALDVVRDEI